MAKLKNCDIKCWQGCIETELLRVSGNVKWYSNSENHFGSFAKTKHTNVIQPGNFTPGN